MLPELGVCCQSFMVCLAGRWTGTYLPTGNFRSTPGHTDPEIYTTYWLAAVLAPIPLSCGGMNVTGADTPSGTVGAEGVVISSDAGTG